MTHVIIGSQGQIGNCISEFLLSHGETSIIRVDVNIEYQPVKTDLMHVCIPYTQNFISIINKYKEQFLPTNIIVYSTVLPGVTEKLGPFAVHSPVEGRHPNLIGGFLTFTRFVAGPCSEQIASFFSSKGLQTKTFSNTKWHLRRARRAPFVGAGARTENARRYNIPRPIAPAQRHPAARDAGIGHALDPARNHDRTRTPDVAGYLPGAPRQDRSHSAWDSRHTVCGSQLLQGPVWRRRTGGAAHLRAAFTQQGDRACPERSAADSGGVPGRGLYRPGCDASPRVERSAARRTVSAWKSWPRGTRSRRASFSTTASVNSRS